MRVAAWPCAQALCALVGVGLGDERVAPATLARAGCSILDAHLEAWVDAARARVFDGLLAATWVSVNAVLYAVLVPGGRDGRAGRGIAVDAEVLGAVCALRDAAEDLFHASGEGLGVGRLRRASALVGSLVELHQLDSDTLVASYHSLAETEALVAAAGSGTGCDRVERAHLYAVLKGRAAGGGEARDECARRFVGIRERQRAKFGVR